jgi:hypothetical protein
MSWAFSTELNFFSWVELFSAELNFFSWVELQLQLWTSLTIHQLNLLRASWTGVFSPKLSGQNQLNWSPGVVHLVSGTSAQTDQQSSCQLTPGRLKCQTCLTRLSSSLPVRLDDSQTGAVEPPKKSSPTAPFEESLYIAPHISLLIIVGHPHIHCTPNLRQRHTSSSHTQTTSRFKSIEGAPFDVRFVLVLSDLVFLSSLTLISWACCKHLLCDIVVLETLGFQDGLRLLGSLKICGRP